MFGVSNFSINCTFEEKEKMAKFVLSMISLLFIAKIGKSADEPLHRLVQGMTCIYNCTNKQQVQKVASKCLAC